MSLTPSLSIVIPTLVADRSWIALINDLRNLAQDFEIIVVCPETAKLKSIFKDDIAVVETDIDLYTLRGATAEANDLPTVVRFVESDQGRAKQMNTGALEAKGEFILFLHGDSRLSQNALNALSTKLAQKLLLEKKLLYYSLKFAHDGPPLMKLNEWGVAFRSRFLKLPFGDQGFCLSRQTFLELGGFNETAACAEDLIFIITARKAGVGLCALPEVIVTSARKYRRDGWIRTTAHHLVVTFRLTLSEWFTKQEVLPLPQKGV